jgi:hypothetical protein
MNEAKRRETKQSEHLFQWNERIKRKNRSEHCLPQTGLIYLEEFKVLEQSTEIESPPILPVEPPDKKQWEKNFSKRWKKPTYTKNEMIGDIDSIRQAQTVISNNIQFLSQRLMTLENNQKDLIQYINSRIA